MRTLLYLTLFVLLTANSCQDKEKSMDQASHEKHSNRLINETSPYLLQHAHNPVDWYPWGEEALNKAKEEDKLILISVGYSACHWCHVMERESFENDSVAALMNKHFVCIKVDREERPDIDQVYMNAVQLMAGRGGWPLNCFALPDGRPIYGGTYYPKEQWTNILLNLADLYQKDSNKVVEYAHQLTQGVRQSELIAMNTEEAAFDIGTLDHTVNDWAKHFDHTEGGSNYAPKFPLPNNYQFFLRYAFATGNKKILEQAELTLKKMAYGGIYDHIGGGFARYSTDMLWKVPHFEKMLYDNAQLVSLYAEAFNYSGNPLYQQIVEETLKYIKREMTDESGAFYSALDADSEGEEGKYYIWKKEELKTLLGDDYDLFADYYNVNMKGSWEHNNYILLRTKSDEDFVDKRELPLGDFQKKVKDWKKKLYEEREKRIRPGLDDKSLTSWNALMLKAYVDAYMTFGKEEYLEIALKNAGFIEKQQLQKEGNLLHSYKKGKSTINGFLEDYCFTMEAFIALYQATFDEKWLNIAKQLADYSIQHFYDTQSGMFFFTSDEDAALIARKFEVNDNVIPGSNSSMAKALYQLGLYFDEKDYLDKATQMLNNVKDKIPTYGSGYSNWGMLMLDILGPFFEVAIVGNNAETARQSLHQFYMPNKIYVGAKKESTLPLLANKYVDGKTMIYICENKACRLPVEKVNDAIDQFKTMLQQR